MSTFLSPDYRIRTIRLAKRLKKATSIIFDLGDLDLNNPESKEIIATENGLTVREVLQRLGTEVCRTIDPDTWINPVLRDIDRAYLDGIDIVFIPDLRFNNEYEKLKNYDYDIKFIKIIRPNLNISNFTLNHISEQELSDVKWDKTFINDRSLKDFKNMIKDYILELTLK
jgi:hypothetical protein